jgi:hypothetical protein
MKKFRDFESAREFVRELGLKSNKEWREYCKSGNNPEDISRAPDLFYKNKGWVNWGDFLGTGRIATQQLDFDSYEEVKIFVQKLELKSNKEWRKYCKLGNKPDKVPKNPEKVYKNKGWEGWGNFLGNKNFRGHYRSFTEAKEFVQKLELKNRKEWEEYCKAYKRPIDIPISPGSLYKNKGWKGWGDFLGTGTVAPKDIVHLPFDEAREFVQKLELKSNKEWVEYWKSSNGLTNIARNPQQSYKNKGWTSWGNFLGTGSVASYNREYLPFKEAREFVRSLGLKSSTEWGTYIKSGNKPTDIPSQLEKVYKKEWTNWGDFLGTGTVAPQNKVYRPFKEAKEFVRKLGLKTGKEWKEYCKSGNKPDNIPAHPWDVYKEWNIKRREGKK